MIDGKLYGKFYIRLCQEGIIVEEKLDLKALKRKLRTQWKVLWRERFNDEVRGEGIATEDYPDLFVDKGTVIIAIRDYRPLSFTEIWETHLKNLGVLPEPHPSVGGVGKFIRDFIKKQSKRSSLKPLVRENIGQQLKKEGRGWIHHQVSRRMLE